MNSSLGLISVENQFKTKKHLDNITKNLDEDMTKPEDKDTTKPKDKDTTKSKDLRSSFDDENVNEGYSKICKTSYRNKGKHYKSIQHKEKISDQKFLNEK